MTNAELIATIRKEIISRIDKRHLSEQAKNELVSLLSFLNTLESGKPMNQEELEKEIDKRYLQTRVVGYQDGVGEILLGRKAFGRIARHFAEWGAEHAKNEEEL